MQQASINLTQSLHEVYEPDWHGKDDVMVIGKDCDALWEDFHNKLVDSTLLNLDEYLLHVSRPEDSCGQKKSETYRLRQRSASYGNSADFWDEERSEDDEDDELKKAQRVFDELDVGLQDELPSLWESRVGFYISTYKSVTSLEAKFHREISLVCRQLYEVMTKLAEQHSDKMFTIQGAPSDSGPLRLARTPSPPEDESPPESPDASSNHMLRPVSPGPPRPKSPIQLKKGPPVPPPPKATPTKEVAEEQIIDLFGGDLPITCLCPQPNERPGESLLDMDFDAFQPDESVSPIPQVLFFSSFLLKWPQNGLKHTFSKLGPSGTAADTGFVADWSADFGSVTANGDAASGAEAPAFPGAPAGPGAPGAPAAPGASAAGPEGAEGEAQSGAQGWPQGDACQPGGDATTPPQPEDSEAAIAPEDEVSSWDHNPVTYPNLHPSAVGGDEAETEQADSGGDVAGQEDRRKSTPGLIFTNEYGEQIQDSTEDRVEKWSRSPDGSGSEYETAEEWGDGGQGGGWTSADDELLYEDPPHWEDAAKGRADGEASDQPQTASADMTNPPKAQGGAFDSDPFAETQGGGAFDSDPFAETQGGGAFVSDPFAETQGGGAFESDPFAETQGGGAFESDPFAETQGGGAFDSDPFAETQGGGAFDSDPFAETQGGGAFDSDPFAETQGGGAFESDPFAETQGGGAFDSDPFAETQGGGAFESDPFAETQGGGAFDSDPFAETQGGGAFDSDPFAETQGGGAFDSDPFAETQGGGAFDSDPFAETQGGDRVGGVKCDPFSETSGEGDLVSTSDGGTGWDTDPFANSLPAASADTEGPATNTTSWQEVGKDIGFNSSVTQENSASFSGIKDVNVPRIHKEPENSDMSEDEAANRRFGKLYQELDTEKEEVNKEFNGFSQDAAASSFFADFDKMEPAAPPAGEATEQVQEPAAPPAAPPAGEAAEQVQEPSAPPAGEATEQVQEPAAPPAGEAAEQVEEPAAPPAGEVEEPAAPPAGEVEEPAAPPAGEEDTAESCISPKEKFAEKMPIPSVVIEPASSNEGDDDRDADIISPTATSDNDVTAANQTIKHMSPSGGVSGLPDDFLYKVETIHDFEAANSDELELKKGDVVLVVPTASVEDQDAGWLTGFKENDWLALGVSAVKGLFPDNFTQRLE
ncbi:amphiphysin [Scomber scombrus]|uniref:Amphiphysin n=1 Tax=Scomber scombrus TaxID=13677 RepID=A0AAV1QDW3_SCOSC